MLNKPESKNEGMGYFPFLLDKHSRDEHSHMQMTFWVNGEKCIMSLEFDSKRIYDESLIVYTSARPTTLYKRLYQPDSDHTEVSFGAKAGIDKATQRAIEGNTTNNCTVMAAFGQSNAHVSKLNDVFDFFLSGMQNILTPRDYLSFDVKNELKNDKDGKKKRFLLQLLKASDFNIEFSRFRANEDKFAKTYNKSFKDYAGTERYEKINKYITTTIASSTDARAETLDSSWETYINSLNVQVEVATARMLPTVCVAYFEYGEYTNSTQEDICHVKK
jgi:hypothetical protein